MKNLEDLEKKINSELTTKINKTKIKHNQIYLETDKDDFIDVSLFLKTNNETKFRQLIDITVVDYPERNQRFDVVYLFLSHEFNQRLVLKYLISENEVIPSLTSLFPSANWMEREVFDMYGVSFKDHPDLRRILTDYGFDGYPLRKDFPLTGHTEVRYSEVKKKVILTQQVHKLPIFQLIFNLVYKNYIEIPKILNLFLMLNSALLMNRWELLMDQDMLSQNIYMLEKQEHLK